MRKPRKGELQLLRELRNAEADVDAGRTQSVAKVRRFLARHVAKSQSSRRRRPA